MVDRPDEDAVLAAALSLIDDVYAFQGDSGEELQSCPASASSRPPAAVKRLRMQIASLEQALAEAQATARDEEMVRAWAHVAEGQRAQREASVDENSTLRTLLKEQLEDARTVARLLEESSKHLQELRQWEPQRRRRRHADHDRVVDDLHERIRSTPFRTDPAWSCPRPPMGSRFYDRTSQCDGHRVQICNRYAAFFPFKLSIVSNVVWSHMCNRSRIEEIPQDENVDEIVHHQLLFYNEEPGKEAFSYGPGLFRRECPSDGSVIFAWASICRPDPSDTDSKANMMAGVEMHEIGWARASLISDSRAYPMVFFEEITRKDIRPADGNERNVRDQLYCLEALMHQLSEQCNLPAWQHMENLLVEANLGS